MNKSGQKGIFIAIEGTDGSGKTTQFELLKTSLQEQGYDVAAFDFPQYDRPSSYFVKEYLNGKYGSTDEIGPYTASLFYSLDRFDTADKIRQALSEGKIVLSNRFTGSNMAHQGTKFDNPEQRRGYFIWLDNLEFQLLKIPRPDVSLVLRVPAEIAQKMVDNKTKRSYTDKKRDIHEADLSHMKRSVAVYDTLCQLFPKDFKTLDCVRDGKIMDRQQVHSLVIKSVDPLLPKPGTRNLKKNSMKDNTDNPYVKKTDTGFEITPAGFDFLNDSITNSKDNVYAFSDKLSPVTIAAAMARLSRRGDDMRITILDEFAGRLGKDEKLLDRVITAYGDDSVQQLVGQHVVVENASNLLTKKLEWGRLAAYLEQSTRYIYYDQKDSAGNYKYFTPKNLDNDTKAKYVQTLDKIFGLYSEMVRELTGYVRDHSKMPEAERDIAWRGATRAQACDTIRPVLPVATKSTVGIFASGQALESLIMHLLGDESTEARETGQKLLDESRKVMPTFLKRADKPDRGGATMAYNANTKSQTTKLAQKIVGGDQSIDLQPVKLDNYWPKNEMDIVPDIIYENTGLSLGEIRQKIAFLSYDEKLNVLKTYFGERLNRRHRPGRSLEKIHYSWDLVCDYGIFRDLQRHRIVDDLQWQTLSPRYGYEVPRLVEQADLTAKFEKCFELSLQLCSVLQEAGFALESQYAVLLGHKMRWKLTYNAREAFHLIELRSSPQGHPGYRKLAQQMYEKICEVHPVIGSAIKFVNKDEDPELTRLAAERYTQFKLKKLS
jgi:thymidylate kinase/thymidylate synthase ThyX